MTENKIVPCAVSDNDIIAIAARPYGPVITGRRRPADKSVMAVVARACGPVTRDIKKTQPDKNSR